MSDTAVFVMTQYLEGETKKPAHCLVVAKLDYDILKDELAALHQDASSKWAFLEWRDRAEKAEAKNAAKQARIDALMFEYCPEEMTEEQVNEWKKHQQPVKEERK